MKIAILMTCHNRKYHTLNCLDSLFKQKIPDDLISQIYIVDDGSIDGTGEAIRTSFPDVNIIQGSGELFWCGGMRLAWTIAAKEDNYDAYLWLNDDSFLFDDALTSLIEASTQARKLSGKPSIIVGSTKDPDKGMISYGGYLSSYKDRPILPSNQIQMCKGMNGNIVFIPKTVFKILGNLSSNYTHAMGDMDYSFRASKKNIPIWIAPGFQGECKTNPGSTWMHSSNTLIKRLRVLHSPKGLPPLEYMKYARLTKGRKWPIAMLKLYLRVFFPKLWGALKKSISDYGV